MIITVAYIMFFFTHGSFANEKNISAYKCCFVLKKVKTGL